VSLFDDLAPPAGPRVHTVSELLGEVKALLDESFPEVWVKGEVSSFHHHASGHMYFCLKDPGGMLKCAMFKFQNRALRFVPKDGMEVETRGELDLYAPRGEFQMRVFEMRPAGIGALLVAFEALKKKLAAEGLFEEARKRPLPSSPQTIGVITSPGAAALRDVLHVLRRRSRGVRVVLAPVPVQGEGAAAAIARAIGAMNRLGGVDVLIVGRGGGSLEDLWAFNEEPLVRAVAASRIPVVSAVGHETDFTLCDFAADLRAATPSAAAEIVTTPDRESLARYVRERRARARGAVVRRLAEARARLARLRRTYGFRRPGDIVLTLVQRVDVASDAMRRAIRGRVRAARQGVVTSETLMRAVRARVRTSEHGVASLRARLHGLSPRAVLARGYSLVTLEDGTLVRGAEQVAAGAEVGLEFARGRARARVLATANATDTTDREGSLA
jgi:exodeoxyribonuclease VII large subunit